MMELITYLSYAIYHQNVCSVLTLKLRNDFIFLHFSPEDLDIVVEGQCLIIKGEREVKRGSNVSKRVFNQKFNLPEGAEVDKITSEYKLDGKLIVSVPAAAAQKTETAVVQQEQVNQLFSSKFHH